MNRHPSGRPIRRPEVKKLSIIRNPGTGALLERLRPSGRLEEIGFHQPRRMEVPDVAVDWWIRSHRR